MGTLAFNRLSSSIRRLFKFLSGAHIHEGFYCVGSNFHVGFECVGEANALELLMNLLYFQSSPWELLMVILSYLHDI